MKKGAAKRKAGARRNSDEILPEYDFSRARPNKYAAHYAEDSIAIVLEPDVAAVFPSAEEANEALRALALIIRKHHPRRTSRRLSA